MLGLRSCIGLGMALLLAAASGSALGEEKKGTVVGVVTERSKNSVDVKADGEEKARRYTLHLVKDGTSTDKATIDLLPTLPIGARVKLDWIYAERYRVLKVEVLKTDNKDKKN
jgi:hypothetical protein